MPDLIEYIGPLDQLEQLVQTWRKYAASLQPVDERHRLSGVKAGISTCADQLAETLKRMLADA